MKTLLLVALTLGLMSVSTTAANFTVSATDEHTTAFTTRSTRVNTQMVRELNGNNPGAVLSTNGLIVTATVGGITAATVTLSTPLGLARDLCVKLVLDKVLLQEQAWIERAQTAKITRLAAGYNAASAEIQAQVDALLLP